MPGVARAAANGLPASRLARAIKPACGPKVGQTQPGQADRDVKIAGLELIFKIELIAGAANVVAGAGDGHPVGRVGVGGSDGRTADVLRRKGDGVKLTRVLVAMVLGGMA